MYFQSKLLILIEKSNDTKIKHVTYHGGSFEEVRGQIRRDEVGHPVAELRQVFVAKVGRRHRRRALATPRSCTKFISFNYFYKTVHKVLI